MEEIRIQFKLIFGHSPKTSNFPFQKIKTSSSKQKAKVKKVAERRSPRELPTGLYVDQCVNMKMKKCPSKPLKNLTAILASTDSKTTGKHQCHNCDKVFAFKNSLKKHIQTKHSASSYQCDLCQKTFIYKDSVLRHKQTVHSDKTIQLQCKTCSHTFKYKYNLNVHEKKYH